MVWRVPDRFPVLKNNYVHVWRADLDLPDRQSECLETFLSQDEITRANKFRFARHRRRFVVARGILRQILGSYLNIAPQNLVFTYGDNGKPELKPVTELCLQFNISHSHEYALFAFTLKHLIGVDLEYLRPVPDALKIARRFFSSREYQMLLETETEKQAQLFFRLWTAKESYLKAIGKGLADSLANVEIAFDSTDSLYLLAIEQKSEASSDWSVYSCTPSTNYLAAIAIKASGLKQNIDYWHWQSNLPTPKK